jgi:hypothetical protein
MNSGATKIAAGVLAAALLTPSVSLADCPLTDLDGSARLYAVVWDGQEASWINCRVNISPTGEVTGSCINSEGQTPNISDGSISKFGNSCSFRGQFTLAGLVHRIRHGTFAADLLTASGVGTIPGGSFLFTLTRVRPPT